MKGDETEPRPIEGKDLMMGKHSFLVNAVTGTLGVPFIGYADAAPT
jgi:hypothetical protein